MGRRYMLTIYDHPADHPNSFVMRQWVIEGRTDPVQDPEFIFTSTDIRDLRVYARVTGRVCVGRRNEDDPKMLETWI
jgi:hypothetical protein